MLPDELSLIVQANIVMNRSFDIEDQARYSRLNEVLK